MLPFMLAAYKFDTIQGIIYIFRKSNNIFFLDFAHKSSLLCRAVYNVHYAMFTMQCWLSSVDYPMLTIQCWLYNVVYPMLTIQWWLSNVEYPMLPCNVDYSMMTIQCWLSNADYPMLTM